MRRETFIRKCISVFSLIILPVSLKSEGQDLNKDDFSKEFENIKSLKDVTHFLNKLPEAEQSLNIEGEWSIGTILTHCAQSISYSITGYPEMKSSFFRNTIGSVVFSIFSMRGKMSHGLEDPIPGAEKLNLQISFVDGKNKLIEAIRVFESKNTEDLKPHFAYGELTKEEYDNAHTLHIKNHFQRINLI